VLPALVAQPRPEHLPLSFAQERLWFLNQLDATSNQAYTIPLAVRIVGDLPPAVIQMALQQLVDRHSSLRTTFYALDGQPYQRIAPTLMLALSLHDLRGRSEADVHAAIHAAIAEPFDLERGPLLRVTLLREADDRHVLVLTLHHSITDGWSMELLLREFAQALAAARLGEPTRFAPRYCVASAWPNCRGIGRPSCMGLLPWLCRQIIHDLRCSSLPGQRCE